MSMDVSKLIPSTPLEIDNDVKALVEKLDTGTSPVFLDVTPESYAQINECVAAVQQKISEEGGEEKLGWQIWAIPGVMIIEAEFHSVWVSPTGEMKDITPKQQGEQKVLFLPDPNLKYEGIQINNVRLNVSPKNHLIDDLILIFDTEFRLSNEGDLAHQSSVKLNTALLSNMENLQGLITHMIVDGCTRNSRCYCSRGQEKKKKFKHCCGQDLTKFMVEVVEHNT